MVKTYKTFFEKDLFDNNVWNPIDEDYFVESLNMYNYLFNKKYTFLSDSTVIFYSLKVSGEEVFKVVIRKCS